MYTHRKPAQLIRPDQYVGGSGQYPESPYANNSVDYGPHGPHGVYSPSTVSVSSAQSGYSGYNGYDPAAYPQPGRQVMMDNSQAMYVDSPQHQYRAAPPMAMETRRMRSPQGSVQDMRMGTGDSWDNHSVGSCHSEHSSSFYGGAQPYPQTFSPSLDHVDPNTFYQQAPQPHPGHAWHAPRQSYPPAYTSGTTPPPMEQSSAAAPRRIESMHAMYGPGYNMGLGPDGRPPLNPYNGGYSGQVPSQSLGPRRSSWSPSPPTTQQYPRTVQSMPSSPIVRSEADMERERQAEKEREEQARLEAEIDEACKRSLDEDNANRKLREMKDKAFEAANDMALRKAIEESSRQQAAPTTKTALQFADDEALRRALYESSLDGTQPRPKTAIELADEEALRKAIEESLVLQSSPARTPYPHPMALVQPRAHVQTQAPCAQPVPARSVAFTRAPRPIDPVGQPVGAAADASPPALPPAYSSLNGAAPKVRPLPQVPGSIAPGVVHRTMGTVRVASDPRM